MDEWGIRFLIKGELVDLKDLIEKAEKYDIERELAQNMEDIADGFREERRELLRKLSAVRSWYLTFNQNIDSAGAKERLAEVLGAEA